MNTKNHKTPLVIDLYSDNTNLFLLLIKTSSNRHSFNLLVGTGQIVRVPLK